MAIAVLAAEGIGAVAGGVATVEVVGAGVTTADVAGVVGGVIVVDIAGVAGG